MTSVPVRWATPSDLPALTRFFRKAYGPDTIFGYGPFLRWYFGSEGRADQLLSIIATDSSGEVMAHYGGLRCEIALNGDVKPLVWGVSAFTLPECRGEGIGGELVRFLMARTEIFGVIGFSPKTADFYLRSGFHLFEKRRFRRFVAPFSPRVLEMAARIGTDIHRLESLFEARRSGFELFLKERGDGAHRRNDAGEGEQLADFWVESPPTGFVGPGNVRLTTVRSAEFLRWRFFTFPAPQYETYAAKWRKGDPLCGAWLVARREQVQPYPSLSMTRIVDIWGEEDALEPILRRLLASSERRGDACVEFGVFGAAYNNLLVRLGFTCLEGDDAALIPQVTAPAEARPNHEYLGLYSERWGETLHNIGWENVHFTRMDSDRDRLAKIPQISHGG